MIVLFMRLATRLLPSHNHGYDHWIQAVSCVDYSIWGGRLQRFGLPDSEAPRIPLCSLHASAELAPSHGLRRLAADPWPSGSCPGDGAAGCGCAGFVEQVHVPCALQYYKGL